MIALSLDDIARVVDGSVHLAGAPGTSGTTTVSGPVETDSREIVPGGLFVAKRGEHDDGHRFADAAAAAGAAALIVERRLPTPLPQIVVRESVDALGALATEVVRRVHDRGVLRTVGVTGSNGKTTTKNLLRAICSPAGPTVASRASFNNEVGGPLTMLQVTWDTRFLIAEMGASAAGDVARLTAMAPPDVGVVLKVGLAHAGEFGGIERTAEAKAEMVTGLAETATAVLNADDPRVAAMASGTRARVLTFGLEQADVRASGVVAGPAGTDFELHLPDGQESAVHFAVLGEHHVANALAAAAAAHALGIPIDTIVAGVQSVVRAERWRMEVLATHPLTVINDAYNASPDSMAAALKALVQIAPRGARTVAVLGEMTELGDLAADEHDAIGRLVVRFNIGQLVVVGAGAKRIHLAASMEGSWDGESLFAEDMAEAEELLADLLAPGDVVLIKSSNAAGLRVLGDRIGDAVREGAERGARRDAVQGPGR